MFKLFNRALLLVVAVLFTTVGFSMQAQDQLPVDSAVRIGKLPNGLTYYIRHNEKPKGQADFYIAQKVGSILEEDNQRGLAHFLEHMCFNGTTHFPGNKIIEWLETKGVKFGTNLNAYTGVDETVYNISNVPVANQAVQDSCLLILHDWANDLLLDPEEIDKERGVIHQEWRMSMKGTMRILENLLPVLYPDSKYGVRLPIGTMEVVDNFPPQALRDYYETWYRPDLQGIIVVGDVDVDYIEGKIKELFSDIEMPENPKERVYFPVDDNEGTIYAIGTDPEQSSTEIDIVFKTDAFPDEMKNNPQYLVVKYANSILGQMLDQRFDELSMDPDSPFAGVDGSYGQCFLAKTKDAFTLSIVPKDGEELQAIESAYRELLRAQRGGFTPTEYDRARAEYLSRLEKTYNGRDSRDNESYVNEYVKNFTDNEPIPSLEDEYAMMSQLVEMIPVDLINSLLPDYVTEDNRAVLVIAPQREGLHVPTQEEIAAVMESVEAEDIEPYQDAMKTEPLIPELPAPGKVVSVADDPQWDAKVLTLSNGVKVYVKNTDLKKDQIIFEAVALGGTSTIGDDQANNLIAMPLFMLANGLGDYSSTDLSRYLQGKQASAHLLLDEYDRTISGSSTVKDLPTMMELIYMTFKDYNLDAKEFDATQKQLVAALANVFVDPQFVFQKDIMEKLFESPASQLYTSEVIKGADREGILDIIHGFVANAADYTFCFVGDVTVESITPLLEQYIATLPADVATATKAYTPNPSREVRKGSGTDVSTMKMETPQTWVAIVVSGNTEFTPKNRIATSMASQILTNRLLAKIREEMGAVYSISSQASLYRQGETNTLLQIPFPMKPELKDEVLNEISSMLNDMTHNVTAAELDPIKEYMVKRHNEDLEDNSAWASSMVNTMLNGVDVFNNQDEVINSITAEDVQNIISNLLGQNNYRVIILEPEQ